MSSFVRPRKMEEIACAESTKAIIERLILAKGSGFGSEEEEQGRGLVEWVREGLVRVTLDKPTHPLDILTVSLHLPATPGEIARHIEGATVMGANEQFIVISTGPKLYDFASSGHYLVFDTKAAKLHLVPWIDWIPRGTPCSCTRRATTAGFKQREVSLPRDVVEYPFSTDVAFPIHGDLGCWVDLKLGMLLRDLHSDGPCAARFVPLPEGCQLSSFPMSRGRPNVHCTVGFVNGSVRLVYMDGYVDHDECPRDQVTISTWSYKGDLSGKKPDQEGEWVRDDATLLRVGDLWDDVSFRAIPGLPKRPPMCPILSHSDPNVVYFFTSDIGYVDGRTATRGEHVLCLNMQSKTIQSWRKCPPGRSFILIPSLIAIELPVDPRFSDLDDQVTSQL
ncbi:hypothetical protein HU200_017992 [Digitaria exilis]|uniref:DUF1618 domain-containing protein n=1 Tax=Digitaria exilis TaxID=1010633 RepID=A0A835KH55_9POAL|nr:hypothetical protein HU200_017992 [Digitaria exilis]